MSCRIVLILMVAMVSAYVHGADQVDEQQQTIQRILNQSPGMVATAADAARMRMTVGTAHIFAAQAIEHQRLVAYQKTVADPTAPNWTTLVGLFPGARQWNLSLPLVTDNPVLPPNPGSTTSTVGLIDYAHGIVAGNYIGDALAPPGSSYLSTLLGFVDERYQIMGAGYVGTAATSQAGPTLADVLGLIASPTIERKAANVQSIGLVLQAHDLMLAQLTATSPFVQLRTIHHHALERLQLGGIPPEFLYDGPTDTMRAHGTIIATYALGIYESSGIIASDTVDTSSLLNWMNSVFLGRYQIGQSKIPPVPPGTPPTPPPPEPPPPPTLPSANAITGGEDLIVGTPQSVDDTITRLVGAIAVYGQIVSNAFAAFGDRIDRDADAELDSIAEFDDYMENTWAVEHAIVDGVLNYELLAEFRSIIAPAMQRARLRAVNFYGTRAGLAYQAAYALLGQVNTALSQRFFSMSQSLSLNGQYTSQQVDGILANKLGNQAVAANPLFLDQAFSDLHNDLVMTQAAIQNGTIGTAANPPAVDPIGITADVDGWMFDTAASDEILSAYQSFPYPSTPGAMTITDYLTILWLDSMAAVDALGDVSTDIQGPDLSAAYQVIQGMPNILYQELATAGDFKALASSPDPAALSLVPGQFNAEFGPGGTLAIALQSCDAAVQKASSVMVQSQSNALNLTVPARDGGNAVQVRMVASSKIVPTDPSVAPLAGGVEGFLPLEANITGYAFTMDRISRDISSFSQRAGRILSIAQRRLLIRSGLLAITSPATAQISPSSILLADMQRALAIQMGRMLAAINQAQAAIQTVSMPYIPPGVDPMNSGRPSAAYEVQLLGDAAEAQTAGVVATWSKSVIDRMMTMQWIVYRLSAMRMAMISLNSLSSAAYAQSQAEPRRAQAGLSRQQGGRAVDNQDQ